MKQYWTIRLIRLSLIRLSMRYGQTAEKSKNPALPLMRGFQSARNRMAASHQQHDDRIVNSHTTRMRQGILATPGASPAFGLSAGLAHAAAIIANEAPAASRMARVCMADAP